MLAAVFGAKRAGAAAPSFMSLAASLLSLGFPKRAAKQRPQSSVPGRVLYPLLALLLCWSGVLLGADPPRAQGRAEAPSLDQKQALRVSQAVIGKTPADYAFSDRQNRPLRLSQFRGKPLLVSFVYTGCFQACPVTTKFLADAVARAQNALGVDSFNVLTIGYNQPFDSPEAMREFALKQGVARPNWEFASADPVAVEALTRDFGFVYVATPGGFDHLTQVTLLDAEGKIATQIYGEVFELQMLIEPLKALLAGEDVPLRDLAGWIEQVRILCTVYDPASGRYRFNYGVFIEIFVGLTVVGSVVFYLINERRRRRRTTPA